MCIFENLKRGKALTGRATGRVGWSGQKKRLKKKNYRFIIPPFSARVIHFYRVNHKLYSNLAEYWFGFFNSGLLNLPIISKKTLTFGP